MRSHRGGDPERRGHREDHVLGRRGLLRCLRGDRRGLSHGPRPGRDQERRRLHRHLPGRGGEARREARHHPAGVDPGGAVRSGLGDRPQGVGRAAARRGAVPAGGDPGRADQRPPLRDLRRGARVLASPPRSDLRAGRGGGAARLPRPAGRLHQDGGRRGPAAHEGPGLPGRGVRASRRPHPRRRHAPAARRGCERRRRLRGRRALRALRRRARGDAAGLPGRRATAPDPGRGGQGMGRRRERPPARLDALDGLARRQRQTAQPPRHHAPQRAQWVHPRLRGARALPASARGLLGGPRCPALDPRRPRPVPLPGTLHRPDNLVRLHPRAGAAGRRRHRGGRERAPPPGAGGATAPGVDHRDPGGLGAGHLRRADHHRGLLADALRTRRSRAGLRRDRTRGDVLPRRVSGRVTARAPRPPRPHADRRTRARFPARGPGAYRRTLGELPVRDVGQPAATGH